MTMQISPLSIDVAVEQRRAVEADPCITTLGGALRAAAEYPVHPGGNHAIIMLDSQGTERRLTYPELWIEARRIAAGMRAHGVRQGDRVLLLLPTSETYVVTLCAAVLLRVTPCTVAAPTTRAKTDDALRYLTYVYQKLDPTLLVVPDQLQPVLQDSALIEARRVVTAADLAHEAPLAAEALPVLAATHPHHIQLTSGTTNRPKGALLSHHNVIANVRGIAQAMEYAPETDVVLSWLPLYHDMGLIKLILAIYYQATIALMTPTSFLRNPLSWLRNISTYGVSLSAAPTFAYSLCIRRFDPAKLEGVDLSSWRRAFMGAEPVPRKIVEAFTTCYQSYGLSEWAAYPCYGMAETVLATTLQLDRQDRPNRLFGFVTCDRIDAGTFRSEGRALPVSGLDADSRPVLEVLGMGYPLQGLELEIRGADDQPLPDRIIGEICVRGSSLMQEYFRDPEATTMAIRDGWYHTGDRGYLVDGELYVLGRIKELIIVRGRNYQPHDIELALEEHEHVRKDHCVVFGSYNVERGTDDVIALVETRATVEEQPVLAQQLQQSLQRVFGFLARDIVFVHHGALPRTTSGKKQRLLAQEWYRAGKLQA